MRPAKRHGGWRRAWLLALSVVVSALAGACNDPGPAGGRTATPTPSRPAIPDSQWVRLVGELSEPGGYFDTDNLISNETGYLDVLGAMRRLGVQGGAYIGVGPDQNFSYMAQARPDLAFIIDIRRDNLLQHLLFRALFELADTRIEYLSLLHGRQAPPDPTTWTTASVDSLLTWVRAAPGGAGTPQGTAAARAVDSVLADSPIVLSAEDRATIRRFHGEFIRYGPGLRFTSFGRAPRPYYPSYAQLLEATDLEGAEGSYLADEDDWQFVKELEIRNRVVPVVGDLAGGHALRAIGEEVRRRDLAVSVLYASNVEFYLWSDGTFPSFAANVLALPVADEGVLIRSYFPNFGRRHPYAVSGSFSTQTLQTLGSFQDAVEDGGYRSYWDLVTRNALDPRSGG